MKKIIVMIFMGLLGGCSTTRSLPNSTPAPSPDEASVKLAESANSISQSLNELKLMEKASTPPLKSLPSSSRSDLDAIMASADWSGPVEPLLRQVAKLAHYRLKVSGVSPAIPVLVTISPQNTSLGDILNDAKLQSTPKANITVDHRRKIIQLSYAKF